MEVSIRREPATSMVKVEKFRAKDGHGDIIKEIIPLKPVRTELESYMTGTKCPWPNYWRFLVEHDTQSSRVTRTVWKN